jgi:uncharacterized phiE125 gp8 family phage protein
LFLSVVTPPTDQPVTLGEAKAHLRVQADLTDDDAYITALIAAVTAYHDGPDGKLGKAIMEQTLLLSLRWFAYDGAYQEVPYCTVVREEGIDLPCPPIQAIDSIEYTDTQGNDQVLDAGSYTLDSDRVILTYGSSWPLIRDIPNAVRVQYVAGYATAGEVPAPIKHMILLMIGHLYQNREAVTDGKVNQPFVVPLAYESLFNQARTY